MYTSLGHIRMELNRINFNIFHIILLFMLYLMWSFVPLSCYALFPIIEKNYILVQLAMESWISIVDCKSQCWESNRGAFWQYFYLKWISTLDQNQLALHFRLTLLAMAILRHKLRNVLKILVSSFIYVWASPSRKIYVWA